MTDIHIIQLYADPAIVLESLKVERDGFYYYIKIGGLTVHGAPGLPDALECNDSGFWYATSNPTKPLLGTVQVDTTHTGPTKITLLDIDNQPEEPVLLADRFRLTDETRNMLYAEHVDRSDKVAVRVTHLCAKSRFYSKQEYNFLVALANILMNKGSG